MIHDYLQTDPRWASHPYSSPGGTMADSGCGPTAIADVVGILPPDVADYMTSAGYAAPYGQGTYWAGIIPTCEHFGFSGVQLNGRDLYGERNTYTEQQWLTLMKTGDYYGILLMGGPSYWTYGGHFIAIAEVAADNSAYAYDPAWSARSGWHPWADIYQGCVKVFYVVEKNSKGVYHMNLEQVYEGCVGDSVLVCQKMLACTGLYQGGFDGSAGPKTRDAIIEFQKILESEGVPIVVDGVCGEITWSHLIKRHS